MSNISRVLFQITETVSKNRALCIIPEYNSFSGTLNLFQIFPSIDVTGWHWSLNVVGCIEHKLSLFSRLWGHYKATRSPLLFQRTHAGFRVGTIWPFLGLRSKLISLCLQKYVFRQESQLKSSNPESWRVKGWRFWAQSRGRRARLEAARQAVPILVMRRGGFLGRERILRTLVGGIMEVPELWTGAFEETWGLFYIPGAELGPEGWEVHASLDHKLPSTIPSPKFLRYLNLCPPTQRTTEETRTWNNDWQSIPPVLAGGDRPDLICLMIPWREMTEKKSEEFEIFCIYCLIYKFLYFWNPLILFIPLLPPQKTVKERRKSKISQANWSLSIIDLL